MVIGTVGVAAMTALASTVLVEVVAGPRLAARSEDILNGWRAHREFEGLVADLTILAKYLQLELPVDADEAVVASLGAEQSRRRARMAKLAQQLVDDQVRYADRRPARWRQAVIDYIVTVDGVLLSARDPLRKAQIIESLGHPMVLIAGKRLRDVIRIQHAFAELDQIAQSTQWSGTAVPS